jgi:predicted nucleic acid-binding protein
VLSITGKTSEIIGRVGAEQAAKGITIPFGDLLVGATAIEQGYGILTGDLRHFNMIPNLVVKASLTSGGVTVPVWTVREACPTVTT